jgi:hypothetical protein
MKRILPPPLLDPAGDVAILNWKSQQRFYREIVRIADNGPYLTQTNGARNAMRKRMATLRLIERSEGTRSGYRVTALGLDWARAISSNRPVFQRWGVVDGRKASNPVQDVPGLAHPAQPQHG